MLNLGPRTKIAAFDVDAQKCFTELCPNELPVPGALDIVDELNVQAEKASVRLGSKDSHPVDAVWEATEHAPMLTPVEGDNVDVRWPRHGVPGTLGFELIDGLPAVKDYDYFVWKGVEPDMHPYGACFHDLSDQLSTGVIEYLRDREIDTVIVGGLALDYCVKVTALQLVKAGFRVVVNMAATRGLASESSKAALQELEAAGVDVVENASMLLVN
ncbi:isochorismatase family protein [Sansalvadorimonas verongulae]|uniref:isochorismatase family protein n=1 Tax=Sansalvadorimonas verongulae TaxID=2172824 RepID=UPI0012BC00AC|nr:isochorismatase family protein [Sansalvadorimonas verongulae]MTI12750.1 isochorismatase family protein [Sansalvadorimonas verongulae]